MKAIKNISKDEQIRQLRKALSIPNDRSYKISDEGYQLQFSSEMKSEIENVLNITQPTQP